MFNSNSGYSLSDLAAVTGNDGNRSSVWGGDASWWIIILFLFAFCGWGGNGFGGVGGGGNSGAAARDAVAYGFDISNLDTGIRGVQTSLSDGFYAQNNALLQGYNSLNNAITTTAAAQQTALCQDFNDTNTAILTSTNAIQRDIAASNTANLQSVNSLQAQLAQCCCENREATMQLRYDMATDDCAINTNLANSTRDIIEASNNNTRAVLDAIQQGKVDAMQDRITALTAQNQSLQFAASQAAQNAYLLDQLRPSPIPAYTVQNPYANYGFGCGCGCGFGCNA